ncbi:LCP family protein [Bacillus sp. 165]|uniref:LCP family protein n=1 Tax=Bacillus sp. 165 TaxID=1529117 RepID=UPI001AD9B5DD|nr:LCP family protein [Bacillus sp. 165]MBO9130854.1 LCP family protein [Bacillus sp. 165]
MSPDVRYSISKKKKRRRIAVLLILPLLILLFGGAGYTAYLYKKAQNVAKAAYKGLDRGEKSAKRLEAVKPLEDNISILIMGVDESQERKENQKEFGNAFRTDALLLATLNKDDKSIKLVSIPRDTRVYIPVKDKENKITHAYAYGGANSTIETVENFLDVPVDYYVKFNFDSFVKIIDTLGGIDLDVPVSFTEMNSKGVRSIHLNKGYQHLDGEQALALARTRHIDNDFMRGQRQQLIIEAAAKKALSLNSVPKMADLIDAAGSDMETNLTFDDLIGIVKTMLGTQLNMEKMQIQCTDEYINNVYYAEPDEESVNEIQTILKQHLGLEDSTDFTDNDKKAKNENP